MIKETALLGLPMLVLGALGWLALLALSRAGAIRARWPGLTAEWATVGLLTALNLGFFWRVLLTRDTWLPKNGGDFNSFYYPLYQFAGEQIAAGRFPLWNPEVWGGVPFAANQQAGLFSPLNLLAFVFARPFGYDTLQWLAIGQIWLASLFAYAFCRELGARRAAAIIGGVTFAYSGFAISHLGHYPMVAVAPWLPMTFLTLRRALLRRSLTWTLATAASLLLALLGGHQQIFLYLLTAVILYWLFLTWTNSPPAAWPTDPGRARRWLAGRFAGHWIVAGAQLGLAGSLAAGLAAPALLTSLQLAALSIRSGISYGEATAFSLRPIHLITLLVPNAFGSTPGTYINAVGFSGEVWGYAGIVAIGLGGFAFRRAVGHCRREAFFFAGLAGLALLVALGPATPLQGWFYAFVPGYSRIRASGRWLLLVDFAIATLAALGTENLLRLLASQFAAVRDDLRRIARGLGVALGIALVALALAYGALLAPRDPSGPLAQFLDSATWTIILLGLGAGLLLALARGQLGASRFAMALVALVVIDLFAASAPVPPTNDSPLNGFNHAEALALIRANGSSPPFRVDQSKVTEIGWQPSWAATAGLESVTGTYDPQGLATYARYWDATRQRHDSPRYDLLNIRYVILLPGEAPAGETKFREVGRGQDFTLYENTRPLPRAFLVGEARPVATADEAWAAINTTGFDPRATVYLGPSLDTAATPQALTGGAPQGTVTIDRTDSDRIVARVQSDREAILVFSEVAYPGWRATIDGVTTPLYTADYLFRAVRVQAGNHEVRLSFTPPLWNLGWQIATASAIIFALVLALPPLARRRALRRNADRA
jgi:hypothetical protein